jgi:uncharacterized membrane protein YgdD (TMEM256/DUF423 family)
MQKSFFIVGSSLAALAVIFGAFGAHALKAKLEPAQLQIFETAVRYQMYHSLALILVGFFFEKFNSTTTVYSGYLFIIGILLFSGSLYLLSMKNILGIESWSWLGPVTPLGGLLLIAGWIMLVISFVKK